MDSRKKNSIFISVLTFGIFLWCFLFLNGHSERRELGFVLILVSAAAVLLLVLGYCWKLFEPGDVGDAFTVLDLSLIASWCFYYNLSWFALAYALPAVFRYDDIRKQAPKERDKVKYILGQFVLFLSFYLATVEMKFAGKTSCLTPTTTGGNFFVISVAAMLFGMGIVACLPGRVTDNNIRR